MPTIAKQVKKYGPRTDAQLQKDHGKTAKLVVSMRHDDDCGNGHNSFAVTASVYVHGIKNAGGCMHDDVARLFPELAHMIQWHLMSTDGPMYYIPNTLYWLGYQGYCKADDTLSPPNLEHARSVSVWPDMPDDFLCPVQWQIPDGVAAYGDDAKARIAEITTALTARLPQLLADFRRDVEAFGLTF